MRLLVYMFFTCFAVAAAAQDKLPEWFLNPPVSPDNSCVYLIGISDPGLNRDDATGQATMRAKSLLNEFVQKVDPNYQSMSVQGDAFETISKQVNAQKYHNANLKP